MSSRILLCLALLAIALSRLYASTEANLERCFVAPPESARPWVYWYCMYGQASKDGVTRDLEAMKSIGIGGAMWFTIGGDPKAPYQFNTPKYEDLVHHVISESDRVGIDLCIHNCDGWSQAGGPWITPDLAMKVVSYNKTEVEGPCLFEQTIPTPYRVADYYKDIACLAYPSTSLKSRNAFVIKSPRITIANCEDPIERLTDGLWQSFCAIRAGGHIDIEFEQPFAASSIFVATGLDYYFTEAELLASDDGVSYRKIAELKWEGDQVRDPQPVSFPLTTARYYRLKPAQHTRIREVELLGVGERARAQSWMPDWYKKASYEIAYGPVTPTGSVPIEHLVRSADIVDLTQKMSKSGRLKWSVPPGRWTILRMGYTINPHTNEPSGDTGKGWECDKLRKEGVDAQWAGFIGKFAHRAGKRFIMTHADSWEQGCQNWTQGFAEEFKRRRGYDISPWLPVLAGEIVENGDKSDRFAWDLRRTTTEMLAENYYGRFTELANRNGMLFQAENADCSSIYTDSVENCANVDIPMGEVYPKPGGDRGLSALFMRRSASGAHVANKPIVSAEIFTVPGDDYRRDLFGLKPTGDKAFCFGINRFVLHVCTHQPDERVPGMQLGGWGTEFQRKNTLWGSYKPWIDYVTRCQSMLQQGYCVSDMCSLNVESHSTFDYLPDVAAPGYYFDWINAPSLHKRIKVSDGKIVTQSGNAYSLLILPDDYRMTPGLLRRIEALVKSGVTILGAKPSVSPSLEGYPIADRQVREIADRLWGDCDGVNTRERRFGKGLVLAGMTIEQALLRIGVEPDFAFAAESADAELDYIHRKVGAADVYFIANAKDRFETAEGSFRVVGMEPEIWYPDTGEMVRPALYRFEKGRTILPLRFDRYGSVFVVFRKSVAAPPVSSFAFPAGLAPDARPELTCDSSGLVSLYTWEGGDYQVDGRAVSVGPIPRPTAVSGPWSVTFGPGPGSPAPTTFPELISWTDHLDPAVRHYSGPAVYTKSVELPQSQCDGGDVYLDLGEVGCVAEVSLNGVQQGIAWKPPYRVKITSAARPGANDLSVKVVNTWTNRLIGDAALPEAQRVTWTNSGHLKAGDPLVRSGLLGPVRLVYARNTTLSP